MEIKTQKEILAKLGIEQLNPMQEEAALAIQNSDEVVLLSPTGTGKTLAFLLPIIAKLDPTSDKVQALILAPSRELAIQIEQVAREMGSGYKVNVVYGGRHFSKDRIEISHNPAILIGTPGRVADHLRRTSFETDELKTLVLDEFDKSLEIGFEDEMKDIMQALPALSKKILTSATQEQAVPAFVGLRKPLTINYLAEANNRLRIKCILSPHKDKLETLGKTLCHLAGQPGIVFCNFKDSIQRVSDYLEELGIPHGCFYGGMEQTDRERALIKFRNGTHQVIVATDLAARGIDIQEIKFIIHYHLPLKEQEFTHRNGRTARMHNEGVAYVLQWEEETLPEFVEADGEEILSIADTPPPSNWETIFISGGRKDKISKGDIAGLLMKQGQLKPNELGLIELKSDCAFVAVARKKTKQLLKLVDNQRIKKRKVRVTLI